MRTIEEPMMEQGQENKTNKDELDFQFYTVVRNLTAVEKPKRNFFQRIFDRVKNLYYGKEE
jgi:hypothetical protein